ncbi:MAG: mechanosensitive ion channel family protein [Trueperaceae bacterium]|nr:mechanosensitive ion channel family protein [Trueperaceae bacterium]
MDWTLLTEATLYGNNLLRWLLALVLVVVTMVVLRTLRGLARRRLRKMADLTKNVFDDILSDVIASVRAPLMLLIGLWVGSRALALPGDLSGTLDTLITIVLILQAALWGNRAIQVATEHYRRQDGMDGSRKTTLSALTFLGRLALFSLLLILALDNLGIDITALLAGIGIASVAIGLALQNILGDLFASLSIVLDKPFEIGDFIIVDDLVGTVENVGLRTTRVRSLGGEQLVFSNNDLIQSRIRNYKRMAERRVLFTLGVVYGTPPDRLREIPEVIREIVEARSPVRFDRAHFKAFGQFSLDFEVVYWMLDPTYNLYMDVQQEINLALVDAFAERGIEFAFPTQTIMLESTTAQAGGPEGYAARA